MSLCHRRMRLMLGGYCGKCVTEMIQWENQNSQDNTNTKNIDINKQSKPVMKKGTLVTNIYMFKVCRFHKDIIETNTL
jgi:hypothetical protein